MVICLDGVLGYRPVLVCNRKEKHASTIPLHVSRERVLFVARCFVPQEKKNERNKKLFFFFVGMILVDEMKFFFFSPSFFLFFSFFLFTVRLAYCIYSTSTFNCSCHQKIYSLRSLANGRWLSIQRSREITE